MRSNDTKPPSERIRVAARATLEQVLRERMPDASRRTLKQLVEHERVRVGNAVVRRLDVEIDAGAVVEIAPRGPRPEPRRPLPPGVVVLFEDDAILVVEKPAGLLTIATEREKRRTLYAALRNHVKASDPRSKIFIVHRLDRDTSGVLVFAKTTEAKERLQADFARRAVDRTYQAVVEGAVANDEGVLRSFLYESSAHKVHVAKTPKQGTEAITRYRVLKRGRSRTLVDIDSSRAERRRYASSFRRRETRSSAIGRTALAAIRSAAWRCMRSRLTFNHPVTGRRVDFRSRLPKSFTQLVLE